MALVHIKIISIAEPGMSSLFEVCRNEKSRLYVKKTPPHANASIIQHLRGNGRLDGRPKYCAVLFIPRILLLLFSREKERAKEWRSSTLSLSQSVFWRTCAASALTTPSASSFCIKIILNSKNKHQTHKLEHRGGAFLFPFALFLHANRDKCLCYFLFVFDFLLPGKFSAVLEINFASF
jgi:hypothetical protein